MDHDESPAEYHHFNFGCSWQPHFPPYHCHLHFRRPRDATFRQDLHRRELLPRQSSKVRLLHRHVIKVTARDWEGIDDNMCEYL